MVVVLSLSLSLSKKPDKIDRGAFPKYDTDGQKGRNGQKIAISGPIFSENERFREGKFDVLARFSSCQRRCHILGMHPIAGTGKAFRRIKRTTRGC